MDGLSDFTASLGGCSTDRRLEAAADGRLAADGLPSSLVASGCLGVPGFALSCFALSCWALSCFESADLVDPLPEEPAGRSSSLVESFAGAAGLILGVGPPPRPLRPLDAEPLDAVPFAGAFSFSGVLPFSGALPLAGAFVEEDPAVDEASRCQRASFGVESVPGTGAGTTAVRGPGVVTLGDDAAPLRSDARRDTVALVPRLPGAELPSPTEGSLAEASLGASSEGGAIRMSLGARRTIGVNTIPLRRRRRTNRVDTRT